MIFDTLKQNTTLTKLGLRSELDFGPNKTIGKKMNDMMTQ